MKAIDFFSGIGGLSFALEGKALVVTAFDQNLKANSVYGLNHPLPPDPRNITSLAAKELEALGAHLWMMGPPCQPFTVRGRQKDLDDPRAEGLLHLMTLIPALRPRAFFLENVEGFRGSRTRKKLVSILQGSGYSIMETCLCPTALGIPNRRSRYYALASLDPLNTRIDYRRFASPLSEYLDPSPGPDLAVDRESMEKHKEGMSIVAPDGTTACFARSYGRKILQSGSYMMTGKTLRRFSPGEIQRFLHLPSRFRFPETMKRLDRYRLLGNSVNVAVVRELLRHFDL